MSIPCSNNYKIFSSWLTNGKLPKSHNHTGPKMSTTGKGRPKLEGDRFSFTSFRLEHGLSPIVYDGAAYQAELLAFSHPKRRKPSPSHSNWFRSLISYSFKHTKKSPSDLILQALRTATSPSTDFVQISAKLGDDHRIMLRKLECGIQAHDWTVDFNRNAVLNFIVLVHGETFNLSLKSQIDNHLAK
jgi:hypothetical protein